MDTDEKGMKQRVSAARTVVFNCMVTEKGRSPRLLVLRAALAVVLPMVCAGDLRAADLYLTRLGPAPLRFASAPASTKDFVWPIPLQPGHTATNSSALAAIGDSVAGTNSSVSVAITTGSQTQSSSLVASQSTEIVKSSPLIGPSIPTVSDGNPLSASNLLLVTPQMLADYFKASFDFANKPGTNVLNGVEVPFNPPMPKPIPSSEAIYRTQ